MIKKLKWDEQPIDQLVDAVNELQESQNTYWTDIAEIKKELQSRSENVQKEPITLLDIFNEMGEMYSSLWNKMEDIHHDLKTKGDNND